MIKTKLSLDKLRLAKSYNSVKHFEDRVFATLPKEHVAIGVLGNFTFLFAIRRPEGLIEFYASNFTNTGYWFAKKIVIYFSFFNQLS